MANVNFRTDDETDRALSELTADGTERSAAIRRALIAQARTVRNERIRNEAERLSHTDEYLAEINAARGDLEDLRAW